MTTDERSYGQIAMQVVSVDPDVVVCHLFVIRNVKPFTHNICIKCVYWIIRSTWALTSAVPLNVGTSPSSKENVKADKDNNCDEEIVGIGPFKL